MTEEQALQKHDNMLTGGDLFIAAAAIGAVGSVVGGIAGKMGADSQADAAAKAAQIQQQQYQQNRTDQMPYMNAGTSALGTIQSDEANGTGFAAAFNPSTYIDSQGYNFQNQQGTNAINSSAAATGGTLNGGTLKALAQYTSGLANSTYGDAYNRYMSTSQQQYGQLFNVAQLGENATSTLGNQGVTSANNQGNYLTQQGNAQAAGDVAVGNGINGALGAVANGYQNSNIQTALSGSSYGVPQAPSATSNPGFYGGLG